MTKKDYVMLAGVLRDERMALLATHPEDAARIGRMLDSTILALTNVLAGDNAKFQPKRFLAACGHGMVSASSEA